MGHAGGGRNAVALLAIRHLGRLRWLLLAGVLGIAACAGSSPMGSAFRPDVYTVRAGDTLYAIAWRYDRDVNELAAWNDLDSPDALHPGQRIRLSPPSGQDGDEVRGRVLGSGDASTPAEAPAQESPVQSGKAESTGATADTSAPVGRGEPGRWEWPVDGEVVGTFADGVVYGRGIDIAGNEGDAVHATAAGEVVYSGKGLQAYGALIIIRHSREYLSAYAHNRRLLVSEGDAVEAGDAIAEMGRAAGEDQPLLHFEIRRDGEPVDPLDHLPKRE